MNLPSRRRHPRAARRRPAPPAALFAVLALLLAACGGDGGQLPGGEQSAGPGGATDAETGEVAETGDAEEPDATAPAVTSDLVVVATTSILGDIVTNLVGQDGTVEVLMPPGVDPHGFQPSAADAALLRQADLVVANGLQLEESLVDALAVAAEEGVRVFELADHLDPIAFGETDHDDHAHQDDHAHDDDHAHEDDDHGHDHGPEDPHVWFDPVRMADGVRLLAAELAEVDDHLDTAAWEQRGDDYATQVLAVHDELEEAFAAIPAEDRQLVTNHDSLGYLADRYDFEVIGTVLPGSSTMAEADARAFAALVATIEEADVPAIFTENIDSATLAEQLATEVGGRSDREVEVVALYTDALGDPGSGAEDYLGLLRENARRITDALT